MIFFNRHLKIGKEIGKATRQSIIQPLVAYGKSPNFVPPPEFLTDMYIYGYITGSIGQMIDYAFGGKNWNKQIKKSRVYLWLWGYCFSISYGV